MEHELLVERTRVGLATARKRGRVGGRKQVMISSKVEAAKKLLAEGMPPKEITQNLGLLGISRIPKGASQRSVSRTLGMTNQCPINGVHPHQLFSFQGLTLISFCIAHLLF